MAMVNNQYVGPMLTSLALEKICFVNCFVKIPKEGFPFLGHLVEIFQGCLTEDLKPFKSVSGCSKGVSGMFKG